MKVLDRKARLRAMDAAVLFVVHDDPARIQQSLLDGIDDVWVPVLVDVERRAYDAWGLGRAPWWRVWLDPKVWRQYLTLWRGGQRLRRAGVDTLQLGGDFVVAPDGTVAYSRPQRRDDRPPVGELLSIIDRLVERNR
ncbi:hypothetical protein BH23ACT8_BH23ACT8_23530 [soil metagenome]